MSTVFRSRAITGQAAGESLDRRVAVVPLRAWVAIGLALLLLIAGIVWLTVGKVAITVSGTGTVVNAPTNIPVTAGVDGTVSDSSVTLGRHVVKGDMLASVQVGAAQANVPVTAPVTGTIVGVGIGDGASVDVGDYLATIAPDSDEQLAYLYVPAASEGSIEPGMTVHLAPNSSDPSLDGYLLGVVSEVSPLPVQASRISYILSDEPMVARLVESGPLVEVRVTLERDPSTPTGYAWTQGSGPDQPLVSGVPTTGSVIVAQVAPFRAFFAG